MDTALGFPEFISATSLVNCAWGENEPAAGALPGSVSCNVRSLVELADGRTGLLIARLNDVVIVVIDCRQVRVPKADVTGKLT